MAIIAANFLVWILYELPDLGSAVHHASFYPCGVSGACDTPEPWPVSWFAAMFMHGSWGHILGNSLFLKALTDKARRMLIDEVVELRKCGSADLVVLRLRLHAGQREVGVAGDDRDVLGQRCPHIA